MAYNDEIMNADDKARVSAFQDAWKQANAAGDQAGMTAAHQGAEAIRSKYGYSGGASGSGYTVTGANTMLPNVSATAPQLYTGQSQEAAINDLYAAQEAAKKHEIESAFNQKMLDYDWQASQIPKTYDQARNQTSAQHEIERQNYNEYAAGNGINTGASSQVRLSQNNAYLRDMNAINAQQADAVNALNMERTKAKAAYQDAIQQAILDNDTQKAQALYQEYQRVDDNLITASVQQAQLDLQYKSAAHQQALDQANLDMTREDVDWTRKSEMAKTLAQYGDFSGYKALGYTDAQIQTMKYMWNLLNGTGGSGGGSSGGGRSSGSNKGTGGNGDNNSGTGGDNGSASALAEYIAKNAPIYNDIQGDNANLSKGLFKSVNKIL